MYLFGNTNSVCTNLSAYSLKVSPCHHVCNRSHTNCISHTHITFLLQYSNPFRVVVLSKPAGTDLATVCQHPHHVADRSSATAACTSGRAVSCKKVEIYLISKHTFYVPFGFMADRYTILLCCLLW